MMNVTAQGSTLRESKAGLPQKFLAAVPPQHRSLQDSQRSPCSDPLQPLAPSAPCRSSSVFDSRPLACYVSAHPSSAPRIFFCSSLLLLWPDKVKEANPGSEAQRAHSASPLPSSVSIHLVKHAPRLSLYGRQRGFWYCWPLWGWSRSAVCHWRAFTCRLTNMCSHCISGGATRGIFIWQLVVFII